jgi:hypothetical protein
MISNNEFEQISELDLDPIKVKLMHPESGEGWTMEKVNAVEVEYRRFLYLMKMFPNEATAPLEDVDTFWHYHILDTIKYADDCQQLFGYFLHHFPYIGMRGEDDKAALDEMGDRMRSLYESTFGEAYVRPSAGAMPAWCGVAQGEGRGASVKKAWANVAATLRRAAQVAWCGVAPSAAQGKAAWCGVAAKAQGEAAWCGAAVKPEGKAAWCGVAAKAEGKAAWCGAAVKPEGKAAWCGVAAKAEGKAAWCGVAAKAEGKTAWCGVAAKAEGKTAWCGVAAKAEGKNAWCGVAAKAEDKTAWCGVAAKEAVPVNAWCGASKPWNQSDFYTARPSLTVA